MVSFLLIGIPLISSNSLLATTTTNGTNTTTSTSTTIPTYSSYTADTWPEFDYLQNGITETRNVTIFGGYYHSESWKFVVSENAEEITIELVCEDTDYALSVYDPSYNGSFLATPGDELYTETNPESGTWNIYVIIGNMAGVYHLTATVRYPIYYTLIPITLIVVVVFVVILILKRRQ